MKYIYDPVGFDRFDPKVIEGYPIEPGSKVEITKKNIDPMSWFVFIVDEQGNRQSVFRRSLKKVV